ncbi:MAG: GCG_CRPN prefix-to-repeats domain-containing protein [Roseiarcus sp.]
MNRVSAAILGLLVVFSTVSTIATPALALGGCGPNGHRDRWGHCVFGGQNQAWCLRHTGHPAVRAPNGEMICYR